MGDVLYLSARYRAVLRRLLHRDIRKCSAAALATFARCGWVYGNEYQLTALGRKVAELSEAMVKAEGDAIQFPVGEVHLEFQVGVTKDGKAKGGARFWVLELGAEAGYAAESIQHISLTGPIHQIEVVTSSDPAGAAIDNLSFTF